jgi:hypothetical protein
VIVIYQGNSSLSNCRVSSGEVNFTVHKFKDDGELRADDREQTAVNWEEKGLFTVR